MFTLIGKRVVEDDVVNSKAILYLDVLTTGITILLVVMYIWQGAKEGGLFGKNDVLQWVNRGPSMRHFTVPSGGYTGDQIKMGFLGHIEPPVTHEAGDVGTMRGLEAGNWDDLYNFDDGNLSSDQIRAKARAAAELAKAPKEGGDFGGPSGSGKLSDAQLLGVAGQGLNL